MSLSSRRAWIEIVRYLFLYCIYISRSPHGERGLKLMVMVMVGNLLLSLSSRRAWIEIYDLQVVKSRIDCRSPHGERGLKFNLLTLHKPLNCRLLSSRRAWIEMPAEGRPRPGGGSLSSRRAWIEIAK